MKKFIVPEKSAKVKKAILNKLLPHLDRNLDSISSTKSIGKKNP